MVTYHRWYCICEGVGEYWGISGTEAPHLGYLPIRWRMCPLPTGKGRIRGVQGMVWHDIGGGRDGECYFRWSVGVSWSTWSHTWESWNFPRFLLRVGSLTLMYMAFLMFLTMPCDSLSTMEKQSGLTGCHVDVVWRWMGDGALRCSLYLSPKVLPDSPMYSSVQLICGHLYL